MSESFGYEEQPSDEEMDRAAKTVLDLQSIKNEFTACFDTPAGQKVLDRLARVCRQVESCYVRGDPYETAFNEGKRFVMLTIMQYVDMDDRAMIEQSRQIHERRK